MLLKEWQADAIVRSSQSNNLNKSIPLALKGKKRRNRRVGMKSTKIM